MTEKDIKTIVRATITELRQQGLLQENVKLCLQVTGQRLKEYYKGKTDTQLAEVLDRLRNDVYFEILPKYYKDGDTYETIAHDIHTSVSNVYHHKRRLCIEIYSELL